jgi:hypothetical protein
MFTAERNRRTKVVKSRVPLKAWVLLGLLGVLGGALATAAVARRHVQRPSARAARTVQATDTAHLHYVRSSGSLLIEEGSATGTLPGKMRASMRIGLTASGSFTIYGRGGTIRGRGSARMHGSGTYESFAGTLVADGGSGRYAHARGRAGLYGIFDRKNYALTVQTTGKLSF